MDLAKYITTGITGATALTGIHQALRNKNSTPRVDLLGEQVLLKIMGDKKSEHDDNKLYYGTLAGDLVSNSIYYSVIAKAKNPVLTGAILGAAAGIMTVVSPNVLGLNKDYVQTNNTKKALTVGYYLLGGLTAGITASFMKNRNAS